MITSANKGFPPYANAHNEMYGTTIDSVLLFLCVVVIVSGNCLNVVLDDPEWEMKWAKRLEKSTCHRANTLI